MKEKAVHPYAHVQIFRYRLPRLQDKIRYAICCLYGLLFGSTGQAQGEEVTVAVASNFTATMHALAPEFEKSSGHKIILVFGSSGKFFAQIKNGAPFEVFFSADQATPEALEANQLALADTRVTYAVGALALWSAKPDLIDANATVLKQGRFDKLALANPRLAPYGAAAVEVLEKLKLVNATQSKWVQGENIAQTHQFVSTGNADIGFVALSQIFARGKLNSGSAWIVPNELYTPIRQDAVLLRKGANNPAARELLRFVKGVQAKAIIESYGYQTIANN